MSYRRSDTRAIAERLYGRLSQQFGAKNVFFDEADIEHGQRWFDQLAQKLGQADIVLALIGQTWLQTLHQRIGTDDVLRFELASALESKKNVIPVLVDGAPMPDLSLIPDLRGLADIQAISVGSSDSLDRIVRELLGRLKPGPSLAVAWGLANVVSWPAAITLATAVLFSAALVPGLPEDFSVTVSPSSVALFGGLGALLGLSIGVPQWLVLRGWFEVRFLVPKYVLVTTAMLALGSNGGAIAFAMLMMVPISLALVLWWMVRGQLQFAGWWSAANAVAPIAMLSIVSGIEKQFQDTTIRAAMFTLVSVPTLACGTLLVLLMRRSQVAHK